MPARGSSVRLDAEDPCQCRWQGKPIWADGGVSWKSLNQFTRRRQGHILQGVDLYVGERARSSRLLAGMALAGRRPARRAYGPGGSRRHNPLDAAATLLVLRTNRDCQAGPPPLPTDSRGSAQVRAKSKEKYKTGLWLEGID